MFLFPRMSSLITLVSLINPTFCPPPCVQHNISSRTYLYTQHMSQNDHITANSYEPGEEGMPVLQCFKDSVGQALDVEM